MLCIDYSQIEMRIMAHLSGDPALQALFAKNQDIHRLVAKQCFGKQSVDEVTPKEREHAKGIIYGIVYGMGTKETKDLTSGKKMTD